MMTNHRIIGKCSRSGPPKKYDTIEVTCSYILQIFWSVSSIRFSSWKPAVINNLLCQNPYISSKKHKYPSVYSFLLKLMLCSTVRQGAQRKLVTRENRHWSLIWGKQCPVLVRFSIYLFKMCCKSSKSGEQVRLVSSTVLSLDWPYNSIFLVKCPSLDVCKCKWQSQNENILNKLHR